MRCQSREGAVGRGGEGTGRGRHEGCADYEAYSATTMGGRSLSDVFTALLSNWNAFKTIFAGRIMAGSCRRGTQLTATMFRMHRVRISTGVSLEHCRFKPISKQENMCDAFYEYYNERLNLYCRLYQHTFMLIDSKVFTKSRHGTWPSVIFVFRTRAFSRVRGPARESLYGPENKCRLSCHCPRGVELAFIKFLSRRCRNAAPGELSAGCDGAPAPRGMFL